jgi:hypothetical protein
MRKGFDSMPRQGAIQVPRNPGAGRGGGRVNIFPLSDLPA